jgi:hypothetical protein
MEHLSNQCQNKSNTITLDELAAQKFPIKPTDCWMVRKKKLWQREQFIASMKNDK